MGIIKRIKGLFYVASMLLLASLTLLQSCTRPEDQTPPNCDDSPPEYYYLSSGQKALIPYTGYDTICMVSNTGDTIRCIGMGKKYFNTEEFEQYSNPACAGHGTEKFYEAYKIEFIDSIKNKNIQLAHYKQKKFPTEYLPFNQTDINDIVEINVDNNLFYIQDFQVSNSKVKGFYYEELSLGGRIHKKLTKIERDYYQDSSSFIYLSRTEGIIQISLNQTVWNLFE